MAATTSLTTTTATAACGGSSPTTKSAKANIGHRHSLRRHNQLQLQLPQPTQEREEEDDNLDELLYSITPSQSSTPDRRRTCQSIRLLDQQQEQQQQQQQQPPLSDQRRPATSRSHLRYWHRQTGRSRSPPSSKQLRPSSDGPLQPQSDNSLPSMSMTKEEFAALPPTIQRKYFSTLERLRFAQNTGCASDSDPALDAHHDSLNRSQSSISSREEETCRPSLRARLSSDPLITTSRHRRRVHSSSARLCTTPVDRYQGRSADHSPSCHSCRSVILDATDEAFVKIGKRHSHLPRLDSSSQETNYTFYSHPTMHSVVEDQTMRSEEFKDTPDSLYDSFRWLEDSDDLDLRLGFEENQVKDGANGRKKRGPLFRRHLSISKLPFGGRGSDTVSRPGTKDTMASPTLNSPSIGTFPSPQGHVRRRSRALSLITPNKMPISEASPAIDPAASHYQDPEARMKLRVYLASPHKFDEAIEFGFPSINEVQGSDASSHTRSLSQEEGSNNTIRLVESTEDEIASLCSDPTSPTELESPRTPESMDRSSLAHTLRTSDETMAPTKIDYAHAPASCREMTLRMTLTRPDLRADEDQIYGWQKGTGRKLHTRDGSIQPRAYTRSGTSKDSVEKQLAEIDHEVLASDNGVVKRFWNRVRRS
ncbi:hypothetical protein PT974_09050 [Cladobotryum mycophilum]|uniref:Mucin n=1 Tax=Cladobotryum mycophilum TaxID=491253 RepID=A0ABR0SF38_9HYPO